MDELRIGSTLLKSAIRKIIAKKLKEQIGFDVDLDLKELEVVNKDGKANVKLSIEATTQTKELLNYLFGKGL